MKDENNEEPITESLNFDKPDFVFQPKEVHSWRQQGPFLRCVSCDLDHSVYIGMEKILTGIREDGTPIFQKRAANITR